MITSNMKWNQGHLLKTKIVISATLMILAIWLANQWLLQSNQHMNCDERIDQSLQGIQFYTSHSSTEDRYLGIIEGDGYDVPRNQMVIYDRQDCTVNTINGIGSIESVVWSPNSEYVAITIGTPVTSHEAKSFYIFRNDSNEYIFGLQGINGSPRISRVFGGWCEDNSIYFSSINFNNSFRLHPDEFQNFDLQTATPLPDNQYGCPE